MRAIFHFNRKYPKPRYHRGEILQNGRFESDCRGVQAARAIDVKVVATDLQEVEIPLIYLCGNCFRYTRKTRAVVDAGRVLNQPSR